MVKLYTCTIIKNEHRYLKEWIDHCLQIGFNEIHLYEDEGSNSHASITDAYTQVFLHSISEVQRIKDYDRPDWKQVDMAQHFIAQHSPYKGENVACNKEDLFWCAFIDPDEYIRFDKGYDLQRLCEDYNEYRGIYLQYKMYGANGYIARPKGGVVENYGCAKSMPYRFFKTNHKSLVNLAFNNHTWNSVHHVQCGLYTDGKQHRKTSWTHPELDLCYKKAWIDHYYTKSWQDWIERFTVRGDVVPGNVKLDRFFYYNKNISIPYNAKVHNELVKISNIIDDGYVLLSENLSAVLISKCGLSTMCKVASSYNVSSDETWEFDYKGIHQRSKKPNGHSFAVWRDPIKRFKSYYQNKVINGATGSVLIDAFNLHSVSVDYILCLIETIINYEEHEYIDSHIRPISWYVKRFNPDDIVLLKDADDYLKEHNIVVPSHQNSSGDYHIELTPQQEQRIRTLYAADYEILKSPKLWKPCTTSVQ